MRPPITSKIQGVQTVTIIPLANGPFTIAPRTVQLLSWPSRTGRTHSLSHHAGEVAGL